MSEEAASPVVEVAPVASEAAPAPVAVTAAPSTPVETTAPATDAAPAETPTESAAPAAEAEAPAAEAAAGEAAAEPAPEAPADDAEPGAEAAGKASPETAEPRKYEDWKLPEGMTIQSEQVSAYNNILGKYGLSQEAGQELMDFGGSIIRQTQEKMAEAQREAFADTRRTWVKDFETKAGNRRNTILNDAKSAIRDLVPDEKARADLWNVLSYTGAGDHPALIYAFAAHGKRMRERGAPGPSLAPDPKRALSAADRRYGGRN